ncbi:MULTISPECIES: small membrane protein YmiC [unclassified Enterobacter]|nr:MULTISPECIES: small membrane protein YmiC [unclassified Enterobacter]
MLNNYSNAKYWSWMAAFSLSLLFWGQLVWMYLN